MKIQLKRSNVLDGGAAKAPTASQLEYGELAVNYAASAPTIFLKNSNDAVIPIATGSSNWTQDSTSLYPTDITSNVYVGGTSPAAAKVALNATGTAFFADAVQFGTAGAANSIAIKPAGGSIEVEGSEAGISSTISNGTSATIIKTGNTQNLYTGTV